MLWNQLNQTVELGWDFYLPVILFVGLIALAVPVWDATGHAVAAAALAAPIGRFEQWDQPALAGRMAELLAPAARLLKGE